MYTYEYKKKLKLLNDDGTPMLPFDDDIMTYDTTERLYVLNKDYVNKKLAINIEEVVQNEKQSVAILEWISELLFSIIEEPSTMEKMSTDMKRYMYACDHTGRNKIASIMISMLRAELQNSWYSSKNNYDKTKFNSNGNPPEVDRKLNSSNLIVKDYNYMVDPDVLDQGY